MEMGESIKCWKALRGEKMADFYLAYFLVWMYKTLPVSRPCTNTHFDRFSMYELNEQCDCWYVEESCCYLCLVELLHIPLPAPYWRRECRWLKGGFRSHQAHRSSCFIHKLIEEVNFRPNLWRECKWLKDKFNTFPRRAWFHQVLNTGRVHQRYKPLFNLISFQPLSSFNEAG